MIAASAAGAPPRPPRYVAAAGTLAIASVFLLVALGAVVVHARNMRAASIVCEIGTPTLGGWAEPDTCEGAPEDQYRADHRAQHLLDPWTSAAGTAAVIGAAGLVAVWSVARLNGAGPTRAVLLFGAECSGLVLVSAIAYQALLIP